MGWIAITFYTEGTGYEREVERLIVSATKWAVPLRLYPVKSRGSWRANLNYKSELIMQAAAENPGVDIVFVDADAAFRSYPTIFDTLSAEGHYDIAVHYLRDSELLSGTIWVRNSEAGLHIIRKWHDLGLRLPGQRHQRCLDMTIKAMCDGGNRPLVYRLPLEYTCIFDHPLRAGKTAVIEHFQASRKYRRGMMVSHGSPFRLETR